MNGRSHAKSQCTQENSEKDPKALCKKVGVLDIQREIRAQLPFTKAGVIRITMKKQMFATWQAVPTAIRFAFLLVGEFPQTPGTVLWRGLSCAFALRTLVFLFEKNLRRAISVFEKWQVAFTGSLPFSMNAKQSESRNSPEKTKWHLFFASDLGNEVRRFFYFGGHQSGNFSPAIFTKVALR